MVLQVFADESGKGEGPAFVVAGWIADSALWADFSDAWKSVLAEPRAINYFSMKEAWHCQEGEFLGWNKGDRDEKVSRLAAVVNNHANLGVHCLISNDDYRLHIKDKGKQWRDPYVTGIYCFIIDVIKLLANTGIKEPVDFIFDEQLHECDKVLALYSEFVNLVPSEYEAMICSRPRFENDKRCMPLQAADMLAWHIRREQAANLTDRLETAAYEIFEVEHHKITLDVKALHEAFGP